MCGTTGLEAVGRHQNDPHWVLILFIHSLLYFLSVFYQSWPVWPTEYGRSAVFTTNGCGSHLGLLFLGTLALGQACCHGGKKVPEPMKGPFCEELRPHSNSPMSDLGRWSSIRGSEGTAWLQLLEIPWARISKLSPSWTLDPQKWWDIKCLGSFKLLSLGTIFYVAIGNLIIKKHWGI